MCISRDNYVSIVGYRPKMIDSLFKVAAKKWAKDENDNIPPVQILQQEVVIRWYLTQKGFDSERCPGHLSNPHAVGKEQDGTKRFMNQVAKVIGGTQERYIHSSKLTSKQKQDLLGN